MKQENKHATKESIIDLEEELAYYMAIGGELEKKCKGLDTQIKSLKVMAFSDAKKLAKTNFSKLVAI